MKSTPKRKPAPLDVRTLRAVARQLRARSRASRNHATYDTEHIDDQLRWEAYSLAEESMADDLLRQARAIERAGRE